MFAKVEHVWFHEKYWYDRERTICVLLSTLFVITPIVFGVMARLTGSQSSGKVVMA